MQVVNNVSKGMHNGEIGVVTSTVAYLFCYVIWFEP